jgi:protein TonB
MTQATAEAGYAAGTRFSRTGLAVIVLAHLLVAFALLQLQVIPLPVPMSNLMVHLIAPPEEIRPHEEIKPPEPQKPRPRPVEKHPEPISQPVVLAVPQASPSPSPVVVPPPPPVVEPLPPIVAPPAPAAIVKPRFDADYLDNPRPVYPALSRRMGEEGRVVLRVQVAANGHPADVALHASSGSPRLDQAALDTVRHWKFVPARRGDEAIAASVLVPIVFTLKE